MKVDVVLLPRDLRTAEQRVVVVLDVLRATTTMLAALAADVREVRIYGDIESARSARMQEASPALLAGEVNCVKPPGFDLGNSPGQFSAEHRGKMVFMSTTNGTRAILAARSARAVLIGALVNAEAVARAIAREGIDVLLLCAGTNGHIAMEDLIGAGAVIDAMIGLQSVELESDVARIALGLYRACAGDLLDALSEAQGGRNVIAVGLAEDVQFAARLNAVPVVGVVEADRMAVVRA